MQVKMHPKPMKRHNSEPQTATCDALIRLEAPGAGLHLRFRLDDGSTQLVVFSSDALEELERAAKLARAGVQFESRPLQALGPHDEAELKLLASKSRRDSVKRKLDAGSQDVTPEDLAVAEQALNLAQVAFERRAGATA